MARLPQPGSDAGNWGAILNDFLTQALDANGRLKTDTVGAPQLSPQSVTSAALADGHVTAVKLAAGPALDGQVLSYSSGNLTWATPSSGSGSVLSTGITDASTIGRAILTAADAIAIRTAIGAGTSSLTIGTTSSTAKAGDYHPTADEVTETVNNKIMTASERTKLNNAVTGPITANDNALVRFDQASGKIVKNSPTTVLSDTGILSTTATTNILFRGIGTSGGTAGGSGMALYSDPGVAQTTNTRLGFLLFGGASGSLGLSSLENSSGIFAYADGTWTDSSAPTRIEFEVAPNGSTTRATAMSVKSSGNVGIGTTSPGAKLDVAGEARVSTAGTSATSVVNVAGAQTLSNKTIDGGSNTLSNISQNSVTNLSTDLAAKTSASVIAAHGMGVVVHGSVASTARPTEFAVITWIGSVSPTNAAANDLWVYKA